MLRESALTSRLDEPSGAQRMVSVSRTPVRNGGLLLRRPQGSTSLTKSKPYSSAEFSKPAVHLHLFTSERLHALFTLSSKYFSTFPHGTCSLSDSCMYLALDGVYHPLWAAFTYNPTPRSTQGDTGLPDLHPHGPFTLCGPCPYYRVHCRT